MFFYRTLPSEMRIGIIIHSTTYIVKNHLIICFYRISENVELRNEILLEKVLMKWLLGNTMQFCIYIYSIFHLNYVIYGSLFNHIMVSIYGFIEGFLVEQFCTEIKDKALERFIIILITSLIVSEKIVILLLRSRMLPYTLLNYRTISANVEIFNALICRNQLASINIINIIILIIILAGELYDLFLNSKRKKIFGLFGASYHVPSIIQLISVIFSF